MSRSLITLPPAMAEGVVQRYRDAVPVLFGAKEATAKRTFEFFAVGVRNANTRKAYARAVSDFAAWCESHGVRDVRQVQPVHVAAFIEGLKLAPPSVSQKLAALRMLFDWLVVGQVLPTNPAASVRGPRFSAKEGKTPVLSANEVRALLDSIDITTELGLRDRALLALMVYTFARVGATTSMRVNDVYRQENRTWVRLHEKGGKRHEMPCHHKLEEYLCAYLERSKAASSKGYLFCTGTGRRAALSDRPMNQADVYRMIKRRVEAAGVHTQAGCHSFRASGITEYLKSGGTLEAAQRMAGHESARTTALYDRRGARIGAEDVDRLAF